MMRNLGSIKGALMLHKYFQRLQDQISYKGFHKDKSQEKKPESEDTLPLQQRPDFTDAFDTLYLGCKFFRGGGGWFVLPSGR